MAQSKLGKGLSALMEEEYSDNSSAEEGAKPNTLTNMEVNAIRSGKYQPRKSFDEGELGELAASIAQNGVMQPIIIRPIDSDDPAIQYEIIAGERRWRASRRIGLETIPAIIREVSDQQALELALVENVQREDLSPLEEAVGYKQLIDEFNYTQEQLAGAVGKSRSHIANLLRLLTLPEEVKAFLESGSLTMGHARALMTTENPVELAKEVVAKNLNVRQTEKLAKGESADSEPKTPKTPKATTPATPIAPASAPVAQQKSEDILALEATLSESLGLSVEINDFGQQQGQIIVNYSSLEELDLILRRMSDTM